jgi:hypothetical protein
MNTEKKPFVKRDWFINLKGILYVVGIVVPAISPLATFVSSTKPDQAIEEQQNLLLEKQGIFFGLDDHHKHGYLETNEHKWD